MTSVKPLWDKHYCFFGERFLLTQFEVYKDNARLFRWRMRADNNNIIAESCEGFYNRSDCENAVNLVKNEASRAGLILNNT